MKVNDQTTNLLPPLPTVEELEEKETQNRLEYSRAEYDAYAAKYGIEKENSSNETFEEQTAVLKEARITTKSHLKAPSIFLSIGGISFIESGDIFVIKGKPKTGKTTVCKVMSTAALKGECCGIKAEKENLIVAYIDTEQKALDTQGILKYVQQIGGEGFNEYIDRNFFIFSLRKRDYTTLISDLLRIVIAFRPDIIIVDGIADFVRSFNDEEASRMAILQQLRIVEDFNCAIINLIHENKATEDHNPKGHLGQLLSQKDSIMMETKKDGGVIKVSCTASRHAPIPNLYLTYDEQGMIRDASATYNAAMHEKKQSLKNKYKKIAQDIISEAGGQIKRAELSKKMEAKTGKSRPYMSDLITQMLGKDLFLVNDMVQNTPSEQ